MAEVTLSSKHQIVVPREARHALGVKPGAKLQVVVRGATVILMRKPPSAAAPRSPRRIPASNGFP